MKTIDNRDPLTLTDASCRSTSGRLSTSRLAKCRVKLQHLQHHNSSTQNDDNLSSQILQQHHFTTSHTADGVKKSVGFMRAKTFFCQS